MEFFFFLWRLKQEILLSAIRYYERRYTIIRNSAISTAPLSETLDSSLSPWTNFKFELQTHVNSHTTLVTIYVWGYQTFPISRDCSLNVSTVTNPIPIRNASMHFQELIFSKGTSLLTIKIIYKILQKWLFLIIEYFRFF